MKMFCISNDVDTAVGLRLTGIETTVVQEKEEAEQQIDRILQDETIGILIVTEPIYEMAKPKLEDIRKNRKMPLLVKIEGGT